MLSRLEREGEDKNPRKGTVGIWCVCDLMEATGSGEDWVSRGNAHRSAQVKTGPSKACPESWGLPPGWTPTRTQNYHQGGERCSPCWSVGKKQTQKITWYRLQRWLLRQTASFTFPHTPVRTLGTSICGMLAPSGSVWIALRLSPVSQQRKDWVAGVPPGGSALLTGASIPFRGRAVLQNPDDQTHV